MTHSSSNKIIKLKRISTSPIIKLSATFIKNDKFKIKFLLFYFYKVKKFSTKYNFVRYVLSIQ